MTLVPPREDQPVFSFSATNRKTSTNFYGCLSIYKTE